MGRQKANIHYLYKTTCKVTGRYYIGMHSTNNLEDGYMGSGKRLRYSLRKHGKENHVKNIIEFFERRELLIEAEKKIVNKELLSDINCMNLCVGGEGGRGFTPNEQKINAIKSNEKQKILRETDSEWVNNRKKNVIKSLIKQYEEGKRKKVRFFDNTGVKHSFETIQKMKKSKNRGDKNSQYGTQWITNGTENKKIKKDADIPAGWYKGRNFNN
jgi:hypothetical protein